MPSFRLPLMAALALACSACRAPQPPPTDEPPEPQATSTTAAKSERTPLRDAVQAPLDQARATGEAVQQAADAQRDAIDAATD